MTLFAGDEYEGDDVTSGPLFDGWERDDLACLHPDDVEAAEVLGRVRAWDEPDVEPVDGDGSGGFR